MQTYFFTIQMPLPANLDKKNAFNTIIARNYIRNRTISRICSYCMKGANIDSFVCFLPKIHLFSLRKFTVNWRRNIYVYIENWYPKTINQCGINSCDINFCDINFCEFGPHSQKIMSQKCFKIRRSQKLCGKNLLFFTCYFCPKYMNIKL